ncbi:S-layer homology domain-containing protein [Saccharibacillus qingshengii]|uniref:S-layer homology domain-containing protein n=1 Tax=Saccharibacillus qingshengii TaxID=1763540 RepID=UPI001553F2E1|nr:S-layer homology domain-containing protein [Saccharibacillus qingshengii]
MKKNKIKILTTLMLAASLTVSAVASAATFKDVKSTHWAYSAVEWGTKDGIVKGYPDGTYKPDKTVTEEEFLSMLIRSYNDLPDTQNPPYWSYKYYAKAKALNYPLSSNRVAPINRTKVAEIVSGTQGKNYTGTNAIKYMLAEGLAAGKTGDKSVSGYRGTDVLTRAEAVAFIKNVINNRDSDQLLPRPTKPSTPVTGVPDGGSTTAPNKGLEVIGADKADSTLMNRGNAVNKALAGTGLVTTINTEQGVVVITDPKTNNNIFVFKDDSYKDPAFGVVIKYDYLVDTTAKEWRTDYVNAMAKAMTALGVNSGSTFVNSFKDPIYKGTNATYKVGSKTFHITPVNVGQGVISE